MVQKHDVIRKTGSTYITYRNAVRRTEPLPEAIKHAQKFGEVGHAVVELCEQTDIILVTINEKAARSRLLPGNHARMHR